jgi:acetyl-CoA decarbonylase/synthase complex subunit gamma
MARWGVGRMDYTVIPGLYALGAPDPDSPVLVTANYKMTFDRLRRSAAGIDAWILVLDTDGINVWCAAGKGSFGTDELVHRIEASRLEQVVNHRLLILPQLSAPGVAAHEIARRTGFEVVWGPVMSEDLPAFLTAGNRATPEMRRKRFPLRERLALTPVELVAIIKPLLLILPAVLVIGGFGGSEGFWSGVVHQGLTGVLVILGSVLAGAVLTPLLLPWLPCRPFSLKGAWVGLAAAAVLIAARVGTPVSMPQRLETAAWLFIGASVAAFLAMNFTGSSTYTSLSGVRREMRIAVPLQVAGTVVGLGLWLGSLWLVGGAK